jgi:predicted esterase
MSLTLEEAIPGPHSGARILTAGSPPHASRAAVVFCHGRGAAAEDMLEFAEELALSQVAWVAPQANGSAWYPASFLAPLRSNEPQLSSALALLGGIIRSLERAGVPPERQLLMGFSQGGCLTLEFAGRNARRYGAVVGLSAGLIGPIGRQWNFTGSLERTPVLLGCSDRDPHIPRDRVEESAQELARIGGDVDLQIYTELGHTVNRDELERVRKLLDRIAGTVSGA